MSKSQTAGLGRSFTKIYLDTMRFTQHEVNFDIMLGTPWSLACKLGFIAVTELIDLPD